MKKMRDQYHRRRDFIVRRFNEIGLKCHLPRGSFYAFPDVVRDRAERKRFCHRPVAGGKSGDRARLGLRRKWQGFCRACFATSYEQLIEASNRIERHVQSLAKKQ